MDTLTALLLLGALAWLWADSLRARERALMACRAACRQHDVELLDQSVAFAGLRIRRSARGGFFLRRLYAFEFTVTAAERRPGWVILAGHRIAWVRLDTPDGAIWIPGDRAR